MTHDRFIREQAPDAQPSNLVDACMYLGFNAPQHVGLKRRKNSLLDSFLASTVLVHPHLRKEPAQEQSCSVGDSWRCSMPEKGISGTRIRAVLESISGTKT